jgi:hypothetical protein
MKRICLNCGEWFDAKEKGIYVCPRCAKQKVGVRGNGRATRKAIFPDINKVFWYPFLGIMSFITIMIIYGIAVSL